MSHYIPIELYPSPLASDGSDAAAAAAPYINASKPQNANLHRWQEGDTEHLLVVNGSQLFDLPASLQQSLEQAIAEGNEDQWLTRMGVDAGTSGTPLIDDTPVTQPRTHAFSLAVAQKCNLGCSYCYAQQGDFGGSAKNMSLEVALKAVDTLLAGTEDGGRFNLAFMGGEPLVNKKVLVAATEYAAEKARQRDITPMFSITTNGTLLNEGDGDFFERFGFAVTISLDGIGEVHDRLRPFKSGKGSFERIMKNVRPLLAMQRQMQVTTRVTVTVQNLSLKTMLDGFLAEGFHSVGFSPMLSAPNGQLSMDDDNLQIMLGEMIACGREYERQVMAGKRYAFANMNNAIKEIGKGTHRPYPCGAGAGYLGVSAEGELSACHRFVDDQAGAMGNLSQGIDLDKQNLWLSERHVHQQTPCNSCWARYLCGGGCHHEVIGEGRMACDYVRGWLQYCMEAYLRLSQHSASQQKQQG